MSDEVKRYQCHHEDMMPHPPTPWYYVNVVLATDFDREHEARVAAEQERDEWRAAASRTTDQVLEHENAELRAKLARAVEELDSLTAWRIDHDVVYVQDVLDVLAVLRDTPDQGERETGGEDE